MPSMVITINTLPKIHPNKLVLVLLDTPNFAKIKPEKYKLLVTKLTELSRLNQKLPGVDTTGIEKVGKEDVQYKKVMRTTTSNAGTIIQLILTSLLNPNQTTIIVKMQVSTPPNLNVVTLDILNKLSAPASIEPSNTRLENAKINSATKENLPNIVLLKAVTDIEPNFLPNCRHIKESTKNSIPATIING